MIGDFLKRADNFIREENFEAAEKEVEKALIESPNNFFAKAYQARIAKALGQTQENNPREEEQQEQRDSVESTPNDIQESIKEQEQPISMEQEPHSSPLPERTFKPFPMPTPLSTRETSFSEIEQYKRVLRDIWKKGIPTTDEAVILKKIRNEFRISDDTHQILERGVKLDCYVEAIKTAWNEGFVSSTKVIALESLRRKYTITQDEHFSVEDKILVELLNHKTGLPIFVIDDEAIFREVMKESLSNEGYMVFTASTPEEALLELKSVIPALIICDIRFENSDLDGLFIYDQVRRMSNLITVPFIFLSAVHDAKIVKAGLEMGVDDYITKPVNIETLLAVVHGKLKRYRQLQK